MKYSVNKKGGGSMDKVITKFNEITTKHERTTFYTPNQCAFTIRKKR